MTTMKRKLNFWWMLALVCSICLSACTTYDLPVVAEEDIPSDPYVSDWMDTSVKPGEDFYRYCNGRWIDALTEDFEGLSPEEQFYGFFPTEFGMEYMERIEQLETTATKTARQHLEENDSHKAENTAIVEKAKQRLLAAASNREQLWLTIGQMMKEGYPFPLYINIQGKQGKLGVVFEVGIFDDLEQDPNPVVTPGKESSKGSEWPMLRKFSEGIGFSPEWVRLPGDPVYLDDNGQPEDVSSMIKQLSELQAAKPQAVAEAFASHMERELNKFVNISSGNESQKEYAVSRLKGILSYDLHHEYCQKYVKPGLKENILQICERLRKAYRKRIEASTWMGPDSKTNAIEKLDMMAINVGYPEEWYDEALPHMEHCKGIVDDYLEAERAYRALRVKMVGMTPAEAEFNICFLDPFSTLIVNAKYQQDINGISIYPAFLKEPFVSESGLTVESFACATVYAHEITHGFDSSGALSNKYGEAGSIMANKADVAEFQKRIQLLDDCFDHMETLPGSGVMCDGKTKEMENIADLGGFLVAYDACKAWLTEEKGIKGQALKELMKEFIINYGNLWRAKYTAAYVNSIKKDPHSCSRERVNGIVRNCDDWYDLFDIQTGDALYLAPEKRAHIW